MSKPLPEKTMAEFLSSTPPNQATRVTDCGARYDSSSHWRMNLPEIVLWCDNDHCLAEMLWETVTKPPYLSESTNEDFVAYRCKHCEMSYKTLALIAWKPDDSGSATCIKLGEFPAFGPHIPSRLRSLIGEDQEYFNKGLRAETQGLGIGAFAYYRRVVERQTQRLFQHVRAAAEKLGAPKEVLDELERASRETQFSKAVESLKHGLPGSLKMNGQNPLLLLHGALSDGLHAQDDGTCLQYASAVRVVLGDLAERIHQAMKARTEVDTAVSELLRLKAGPKSGS